MSYSGDPRLWAKMGEAMQQYPVPDLREMKDVTPKPSEPALPPELKKLIRFNKRNE